MIMRHFYTILFFLLLTFKSFSQAFSVSDLIKMSKMNLEAFDTYISSNGYDYLTKTSEEIGLVYGYVEYDKLDSKRQKRAIAIVLNPTKPLYSVSYTTSIKDEYSKFKNETLALGFNLYKTEEIENNDDSKSSSIIFRYKKEKQIISITNKLNSYTIVYTSIPD